MIGFDDPLWKAALAWWGEKQKADPDIRSNIQHSQRPTIGCETPAECALATAIAAHLRIKWLYGDDDFKEG
jgi:hypothetical protein